ncbi:MAG: lysophospholipase [Thermobacillus sp. ZCTH02-B1]|uniref:alpha/beta hydrolase n=1 Tax=Thermobacillus sp. ZCTH02-B1 TaxID=1858795 RepID=UPI000B565EC6|nr:alpha/beta hydrolase [Thermobacillus sp. ZCTH02-B1]OUM94863.1 MAG: lysophospholipase [Thermobacillus sp. ZCTH02-B1]
MELVTETLVLPTEDGVRLHVRSWLPSGVARGVVCIVHGMGEHGGRYAPVAEALVRAGLAVYAVDQRGHGLTPGKRGHAPSAERLALDVARFIGMAGARHPGLPVFLYGHSMGGNIALSCAIRCRPPVAGLILTSPWLRLAFDPPAMKLWIGRIASRVWPKLTMSTGLGGSLYRNPAQSEADSRDPLLHNRISAAMFFSVRDEGERSLREARRELRVPVLLMHGTEDTVTSFAASRELAETLRERCEFVPWEGGWHELHNDRDREEVLERIIGWIDGRIREWSGRDGG